jgi:hypothetical protein
MLFTSWRQARILFWQARSDCELSIPTELRNFANRVLEDLRPVFRTCGPNNGRSRLCWGSLPVGFLLAKLALGLLLVSAAGSVHAREKDTTQHGVGLVVDVPFPESEVVQVVQEIAQNGIIRGSKEYNKDEFIGGAESVASSRVFPAWTEGGKVFYKVRHKALDPRNFKGSNDVGTLAVRYIVKGQDETHTVLQIDARFVEDFRQVGHASNGSVEGAEYKEIYDHLESIKVMRQRTVEAEKHEQESSKTRQSALKDVHNDSSAPAFTAMQPGSTSESPAQNEDVTAPMTLEQRVNGLRQQVERLVKAPGTPLKSAPFHTASTLQSLPGGTEVLVVITTPYWYGVETHEGRHGWILRDDVEKLP